MDAEEEGSVEVRKKEKKSKEKSKKGKKNEVSYNGICEGGERGSKDLIEGGKSGEKEHGERGDNEKRKKKKKAKHELGEDGDDYSGKGEKKSDDGKEFELGGVTNKDVNVMEKVEKKKRKREKDKRVGYDEQLKEGEFQDAKSGSPLSVNETCFNEMQNGEGVEAVGGATDGDVLKEVEKVKKKKKKKKIISGSELSVNDTCFNEMQNGKEVEAIGGATDGDVVKEVEKVKKKKKKKKIISGSESSVNDTCFNEMQNGKEVEAIGGAIDGDVVKEIEKKKKKKKKVDSGALHQENTCLIENETQENEDQSEKGVKLEAIGDDCEVENTGKQKKKRKRDKKKEDNVSGDSLQGFLAEEYTNGNANSTLNEELDRDLENVSKRKSKKAKLVDNGSKDPKAEKSKKHVRFSDTVEIFPQTDDKLVRGKRFSKEEDEIVKEAVFNYIEAKGLGEEGLSMVLNSKSHPEIKHCWKEIATCLPHRPHSSIYYRAQVLFRRDEKRKWTEEEIEILRQSHKIHGNQWKQVADELGKHRVHVKDTWRRIRHENLKRGHWSQDEYQALFDLVNMDLGMKYSEEKKSKHGMLRDNIAWTAISDKLSTRAEANCCLKWYQQLRSSMVAEGIWSDADDYRLIDALFQLDASCIEDVDWDNLLDHRSGDVCRKRWNQMVLHIGNSGNKSFADQVEVLTNRYCPDLLEAREAWDSKPIVP